jgi:hypothetical protein
MAILKNIEVTQCDNQLIGLAVPSGGSASVELFDFKLGGGTVAAPIKYSVPNINILQPGEYTLLILGINWGGPATFTVTVDFETGPPHVLHYAQNAPGVGAVFTPPGVAFTIA